LDYNHFVANEGLTLPLDPTITEPTLPTPEEIKNRLSEEAAVSSLKKVGYYWLVGGGIYLALILVGMSIGIC